MHVCTCVARAGVALRVLIMLKSSGARVFGGHWGHVAIVLVANAGLSLQFTSQRREKEHFSAIVM